ncbi:GNAT family N-acetyltransferase [Pseudomonas luteola]|uniref:GNAT family N-acetyltransferase n=1 Tax=Pseudomonas luteola TaxID=47886 RepID=UPI001EF6390F|nr:GNAT family protein [Pseudomonas luteola]MCG7374950.1 GNAT family N-acetyltransferase [Pseudomonas luteola]
MRFPDVVPLVGLSLQRPKAELAQALCATLNASYVLHEPFLCWAKPRTTLEEAARSLVEADKWFDTLDGEKRYFLLDPQERIIGCIGLTPLTEGYEVGYWASEAFAGRGFMTQALRYLVDSCGSDTLMLTTSSENIRSQRLATRAGFVLTAVRQGDRRNRNGQVCDTYVYEAPAAGRALQQRTRCLHG